MTERPKNRAAAFTLVEVLMTVVVLAFGTLYIFPAFFKSGELAQTLSARMNADLLANNLIVETKEYLTAQKDLRLLPTKNSVELNGISYTYEILCKAEDVASRLYDVRVRVDWKDTRGHTVQYETRAIR